MSPETRRHFHLELQALEVMVQAMGSAVQSLLKTALDALDSEQSALADKVIDGDEEIDKYYLEIEEKILEVFALQTPVASDLRLLTALLHINLHLERVADMAVNIAKIVKLTIGLPRHPTVLKHLKEMGDVALKMLAAALDAFSRRDLALCLKLPEMDDPIDSLNRGMLQEVLSISGDQSALEWGIRMHVVSRQLERVGDHAVDIGEQVAFLVTGEFREFTDASHPVERVAGADE
jgi:phosphate transport system protein